MLPLLPLLPCTRFALTSMMPVTPVGPLTFSVPSWATQTNRRQPTQTGGGKNQQFRNASRGVSISERAIYTAGG